MSLTCSDNLKETFEDLTLSSRESTKAKKQGPSPAIQEKQKLSDKLMKELKETRQELDSKISKLKEAERSMLEMEKELNMHKGLALQANIDKEMINFQHQTYQSERDRQGGLN